MYSKMNGMLEWPSSGRHLSSYAQCLHVTCTNYAVLHCRGRAACLLHIHAAVGSSLATACSSHAGSHVRVHDAGSPFQELIAGMGKGSHASKGT